MPDPFDRQRDSRGEPSLSRRSADRTHEGGTPPTRQPIRDLPRRALRSTACLAPHLMQAVKLAAATGNPNAFFDHLSIAAMPGVRPWRRGTKAAGRTASRPLQVTPHRAEGGERVVAGQRVESYEVVRRREVGGRVALRSHSLEGARRAERGAVPGGAVGKGEPGANGGRRWTALSVSRPERREGDMLKHAPFTSVRVTRHRGTDSRRRLHLPRPRLRRPRGDPASSSFVRLRPAHHMPGRLPRRQQLRIPRNRYRLSPSIISTSCITSSLTCPSSARASDVVLPAAVGLRHRRVELGDRRRQVVQQLVGQAVLHQQLLLGLALLEHLPRERLERGRC